MVAGIMGISVAEMTAGEMVISRLTNKRTAITIGKKPTTKYARPTQPLSVASATPGTMTEIRMAV